MSDDRSDKFLWEVEDITKVKEDKTITVDEIVTFFDEEI